MAVYQNTLKLSLLSLFVFFTTEAFAGNYFNISNLTLDDQSLQQIADASGNLLPEDFLRSSITPQMDQAAQKLSDQINSRLDNLNLQSFIAAQTISSAMAGIGSSVDYASNPCLFTLGSGLTAAVYYKKLKLELQEFALAFSGQSDLIKSAKKISSGSEIPPVGLSLNAYTQLGINLNFFDLSDEGFINLSDISLYVGYFRLALNHLAADLDALALESFSCALVYHLVHPIGVLPGGLLKWGGLAVTTGFSYNGIRVSSKMKLPSGSNVFNVSTSVFPISLDLTWSGSSLLVFDSASYLVPLEIYSNLQIAHFVTLYSVLGVAWQSGTTSLTVKALEKLKLNVLSPASLANIDLLSSEANASVDLQLAPHPPSTQAHALLGLQLNLVAVGIYGHVGVNHLGALQGQLGLRVFW